MGLFDRRQRIEENFNDPLIPDNEWLAAGESRFNSLLSRHYGSPDTIADGGDQRRNMGDLTAALHFYAKAIDTLDSIYVCAGEEPDSWSREPSAEDIGIVDRYIATLRQIRDARPAALPNRSVLEVTGRIRRISSKFRRHGLNSAEYVRRLDDLAAVAPEVDVSGLYW